MLLYKSEAIVHPDEVVKYISPGECPFSYNPLLYLGDEIGTLNDYSCRDDPDKSRDSRWAHCPRADWGRFGRRNDPSSIEARLFQGRQSLIHLRKEEEVFTGGTLEIIPTENDHVLGYIRSSAESLSRTSQSKCFR